MFGDLADFRAYHTARGNSAPASASDLLATEALQRGSDYIERRYVLRFSAAHQDTPPAEVTTAAYIAAGLELDTPGFFAKTYTPDQRKVLTAVEGIKWTVVGKGMGASDAVPVSTDIDLLLSQYFDAYRGMGLMAV